MDVIILNGASSSGKSSIAKELQSILPANYLHIGIDNFIAMMPERTNLLAVSDKEADGFYWRTVQIKQGSVLRVQKGSYGTHVNRAYHSTVRHLVSSGLKVIVDDVMDGSQEQEEWIAALGGVEVIFVAVTCNDSILCKREKQRSDRINGSALEQNSRVHIGVNYDLEVSTISNSAQECAKKIATHITKR